MHVGTKKAGVNVYSPNRACYAFAIGGRGGTLELGRGDETLEELLRLTGHERRSSRHWAIQTGVFDSHVTTSDENDGGLHVTSLTMRLHRRRGLTVSYMLDVDAFYPPGDMDDGYRRLDRDARAAIAGLGAGQVRARLNDRWMELLVPRAEDWVVTGPKRFSEGERSALEGIEDFVDVRTLDASFKSNAR